MSTGVRWTLAVLLLAAVGLGLFLVVRGAGGTLTHDETGFRFERGNLVYRFHPAFRTESLFDRADDPLETRNVARSRPEDLRAMRAAFLDRLRVASLDEIPVESDEWLRAIESLGYGGGRARPPPREGTR